MFDLLRGPQVALLGFGAQWQPLIENCKARFARGLNGYVPVGCPGDPRHYVDVEGHPLRAYGGGTLFVVRPDNYVGLVAEEPHPEGAMVYLSRILA